jgi:phosphoglycerol transferase MdoB-like AlkP superfamily enzyme
VGRLGAIRGYLGPWFAEWYYLQDDRVLARALELRDEKHDRLTPLESEIPIHKHLVILQAESLDTNILGYRVAGQEVTPFLNKLRAMSMYYRVRSFHVNGSADADFNALTGTRGSDHENTYVIPGYPYENTTPQLLAQAGFACYSFHGASGEFYNRRDSFEKMGFSGIYFQEELQNQFGLKVGGWGINDRDLLTAAALEMRQATRPACQFIITLTTHIPYNLLNPAEEEIFKPASSMPQRYINNMRYLDNCLRDYITALGAGTTIMIYADHPTEDESFPECDRHGDRQYIPCMIYDSDQDLSRLQKTRDNPLATDGSLTFVDVVNYLRGQIARQQPVRSAKAEQ